MDCFDSEDRADSERTLMTRRDSEMTLMTRRGLGSHRGPGGASLEARALRVAEVARVTLPAQRRVLRDNHQSQ